MMSRYGRVVREDLPIVVNRYIREIEDIKKRQLVGSDAITMYRPRGEFVVDVDGYRLRPFRIVFTPTTSNTVSGLVYRISVTQTRPGLGGNTIVTDQTMQFRRRRALPDGSQVWDNVVDLYYTDDSSRRIVVRAFSTSDGVISMRYL